MKQTLGHFPTLEILVTRVTPAERDAEEAAQVHLDEPLPLIHMRESREASTTACGLSASEVQVAHEPWLFGFAVTGVEPNNSTSRQRESDGGENPDWRERDLDRICAECLRTWDERAAASPA